jgi:hypothetical protein
MGGLISYFIPGPHRKRKKPNRPGFWKVIGLGKRLPLTKASEQTFDSRDAVSLDSTYVCERDSRPAAITGGGGGGKRTIEVAVD